MITGLKVILFDIGGVILRTDNPGPRTRLAQRFGLDREGIDRLVFANPQAKAAETGQCGEEAVWAHVQSALGLSTAEMEDFRREFWAGDRVDLSMLQLMCSLRPRWRVGLLTNSWWQDPLSRFWTHYQVSEAQVRAAVDGAVSSSAVGVQKPDPRIFEAALRQFNAAPAETVLIDDFLANVEAAQALGMRAILFESPTQARRDLLALLGV